jgi:hypothetical protein
MYMYYILSNNKIMFYTKKKLYSRINLKLVFVDIQEGNSSRGSITMKKNMDTLLLMKTI